MFSHTCWRSRVPLLLSAPSTTHDAGHEWKKMRKMRRRVRNVRKSMRFNLISRMLPLHLSLPSCNGGTWHAQVRRPDQLCVYMWECSSTRVNTCRRSGPVAKANHTRLGEDIFSPLATSKHKRVNMGRSSTVFISTGRKM